MFAPLTPNTTYALGVRANSGGFLSVYASTIAVTLAQAPSA
jgi:hypothetical protein